MRYSQLVSYSLHGLKSYFFQFCKGFKTIFEFQMLKLDGAA